MKVRKMYRILSIALAGVLTFVSVDVNVLAATITEDVVEIRQEELEDSENITPAGDVVVEFEEDNQVVEEEETTDHVEDVFQEEATDHVTDIFQEGSKEVDNREEATDHVTDIFQEGSKEVDNREEATDHVTDIFQEEGREEANNWEEAATEDTAEIFPQENVVEEDNNWQEEELSESTFGAKIEELADAEEEDFEAYATEGDNNDGEVVTFEYSMEDESTQWGDIEPEDQKLYITEEMPEGDASKVPDGMWIAGLEVESYTYTGKNITFEWDTEIRVYDGKKRLFLNSDYTVSYKNNKNAWIEEDPQQYAASKVPTVILKGKGNYSGTITRTFEIQPINISTLTEAGTPLFHAPDITLAFNNKVQKGTTKVTYVNKEGKTVTLKAKKDFEYKYYDKEETIDGETFVAYKDVKKTPYTVTIEGKGNYTGTITFGQTITKSVLISKVKVKAIPAQTFEKGKEQKPPVAITYKGEPLAEYQEEIGEGDYTLSYENNVKPGTARVVITGKGDYAGTKTVTFKINGYDLRKAKMQGFQSSFVYGGDEKEQDNVTFSYIIGKGAGATEIPLEEGVHYQKSELQHTDLAGVGSKTVVYAGIEENGCFGTVKKNYKITPYDLGKDLDNRIVVAADEEGNAYSTPVNYVKGGAKPKPYVTYICTDGTQKVLEEGVDYKLSYSNNTKINDGSNSKKMPTIKITGIGNFKGTRKKDTFIIGNSDIAGMNLVAADKVYANKKGNFTTSVFITDVDGKKLKAGTDYEKTFVYYYKESVNVKNNGADIEREPGERVDEKDIVPAGTVIEVVVKGKGIYRGEGEQPSTISGLYRVVKADISKATVKVNKQYYTGKKVCPGKSQIVVTLKGKVVSDKDYEIISYSNNCNKGNGKVTIKGVGNYGGTKTATFVIANKSMNCMLSFNANGATSGNMKDIQLQYGKSYALTKNTYKKPGYEFVGWNTEPDGSGKDVSGNVILYKDMAQDPIVIEKNDIGRTFILYAQWELKKYKITYHLNYGNNHEENVDSYTVEDEVVFKEPTREGYTFLGWYTDSGCTKKITSISKGTTGDKVLYAKWRATVLEEVPVPEEGTYLDVREYGATPNDEVDDTNAIESAVRTASKNYTRAKQQLEELYGEAAADMEVEAVNTVYVPEGTYRITAGDANNDGDPGISLKSNVNLIMDKEAVLYVEASSYQDYCVISAKNVENIKIQGGKILGERYRHLGKGGEYGHGIALYGAKNVEILSVLSSANWGDGIYLGTQRVRQSDGSQLSVGCDNVVIKNCEIFDNRRNNISLTDVDNLIVEHCYIADAHGTAPQCGIYIEPNSNSSGDRICRNITIKDTTIDTYKNQNSEYYMCFMTHYNPYNSSYVTANNVRFINCRLNGFVGNYSGKNFSVDSNTVITGEFVNMR